MKNHSFKRFLLHNTLRVFLLINLPFLFKFLKLALHSSIKEYNLSFLIIILIFDNFTITII